MFYAGSHGLSLGWSFIRIWRLIKYSLASFLFSLSGHLVGRQYCFLSVWGECDIIIYVCFHICYNLCLITIKDLVLSLE